MVQVFATPAGHCRQRFVAPPVGVSSPNRQRVSTSESDRTDKKASADSTGKTKTGAKKKAGADPVTEDREDRFDAQDQQSPEALARKQMARLDAEARASGLGEMERTVRAIDAGSAHLENGRPDLAAALYRQEARRIETSIPEDARDIESTTRAHIARDLKARAALYDANGIHETRRAAENLVWHTNQSVRVADMIKDTHPDHAKLLRTTGTDGWMQAQGLGTKAIEAQGKLGKSFSTVYRNIVDASFEKEISESGWIDNSLRGTRDKLEDDRKKMGVVFDHIDKMIERDGISFHEAWHRMRDDATITKDGELPGFATPRQAAGFLRDHKVSGGLLSPMSEISQGTWEGDARKLDEGRTRLIGALRENGQWGIAKSVLDDFKESAATEGGIADAQRLSDNEWRERWTAKGKEFVAEELPVLVLSGVVSGGAGSLARAGAVALNVGSKARTAAVVGTELSTFVVTERVLNDALNGKRADWSAGAIGRDLAFGAAGYGILKGVGAGWRALRTNAPNLGRFGEVFRGKAGAARATADAAETTANRLRGALSRDMRFPSSVVRPNRVNKLREEGARLLDEVDQARQLLRNQPNGPARARLERALKEADDVVGRFERYSQLEPPRLPRGRAATEAEKAAHQRSLDAFRAEEAALRRSLAEDLRRSSEGLYKLQAPLAGVTIKPVGPEAGAPFARDPIALTKAHRTRYGVDASRNVGYGELTVGTGRARPLGTAASGSEAGSLPGRTNRYAQDARPLQQQPGQHTHGRANDSEVQLLEAAAKALEGNPNASGTLRIFTERPPCASCRRVMARFLAEHPNIKLEVFHNARHVPAVVGIGAGVEAGKE